MCWYVVTIHAVCHQVKDVLSKLPASCNFYQHPKFTERAFPWTLFTDNSLTSQTRLPRKPISSCYAFYLACTQAHPVLCILFPCCQPQTQLVLDFSSSERPADRQTHCCCTLVAKHSRACPHYLSWTMKLTGKKGRIEFHLTIF